MTKADLVSEITDKTGVEKIAVQATVESLMATIIDAICIYLCIDCGCKYWREKVNDWS